LQNPISKKDDDLLLDKDFRETKKRSVQHEVNVDWQEERKKIIELLQLQPAPFAIIEPILIDVTHVPAYGFMVHELLCSTEGTAVLLQDKEVRNILLHNIETALHAPSREELYLPNTQNLAVFLAKFCMKFLHSSSASFLLETLELQQMGLLSFMIKHLYVPDVFNFFDTFIGFEKSAELHVIVGKVVSDELLFQFNAVKSDNHLYVN